MTLEQLLGLLSLGAKKGASDIHLEAGYPPWYRINGELFAAKLDKLTSEDTALLARHVLGESSPFLAGAVRDVDRGFGIQGVSRFRASFLRQRGSVGVVLRVIPFEIPSLGDLHLPAVLQQIAGARHGLVLVTGATGAGKTTTIAALLNHINLSDRLHIVTIEDPVEYVFHPEKSVVIQREVGSDTASFEEALRAAMRQDPDVLMVGEMRDRETAETCLKAAETGHLVISSLHTTDATRTVGRLVGMFSPEEQREVRNRLADHLKAVVSQRLVMRQDGAGQLPAVEVLLATRSVQEAVRDPAKTDELFNLMERGRDELGMQTFDQHLVELCRSRLISPETAKHFATRRAEVERTLMLGGGE
ncbi:MAG: PilT/PilU family type 4a pilus ATPase [Myxococcales bacterium]